MASATTEDRLSIWRIEKVGEFLLKAMALFFQNLTRMVCLMIVTMMAGVWAYLSIKEGLMQPVTQNFLWAGGLLLTGEIGAGLDVLGRLNRKIDGGKDEEGNSNKN